VTQAHAVKKYLLAVIYCTANSMVTNSRSWLLLLRLQRHSTMVWCHCNLPELFNPFIYSPINATHVMHQRALCCHVGANVANGMQ